MTRRTVSRGIVLTLLAGLGLLTFGLHAQAPRADEATGKFAGKVIFVEAGERIYAVLTNPEIKTLGGRAFVTGTSVRNYLIPSEAPPQTDEGSNRTLSAQSCSRGLRQYPDNQ